MKVWLIYIVMFLGLLQACRAPQKEAVAPKAQGGIIDLSAWDLRKQGVELSGEWEFYWNELHSPEVFDTLSQAQYQQLPSSWTAYKLKGENLPMHGFASYRLRVVLAEDAPDLALKFESFSGSFRCYVNGKLQKTQGKLGRSKATSSPAFYTSVVRLGTQRDTTELLIHFSNYRSIWAGFNHPLVLGSSEQLYSSRVQRVGITFFLAGSILIMAMYHLGLFALRRNDYSSLYFGLFSLVLALRIPLNGQVFLHEYIYIGNELQRTLDYLGYYLAVVFIFFFLRSLFPKEFPNWLKWIVLVFGVSCALLVVVLPYEYFVYTLKPYQVFTLLFGLWITVALVVAMVRRQQSAAIFFVGFVILFSAAVNDILHANSIIHTAHIIPIGIFLFIFLQAFLLSSRAARVFHNTQVLSKKLDIANRNLERRVKERTLSLEVANQELTRLSVVADKTENGVFIMDALGTVEWINKGFTDKMGYTLDELKRERGLSILQISSRPDIKDLLNSCIEQQKSVTYESFNYTKTNERFWVHTTLTPIVDEDGVIINLIAIDTDITRMKMAEEEIQQQKEEIELQRDKVTVQRDEIAAKSQRITNSLFYARNIQNAIVPNETLLKQIFADAFVVNMPKDIVSGDFYWVAERTEYIIWTVADCTGHGVPGAFMSTLGITFLNQIVVQEKVKDPGLILTRLRQDIKRALLQNSEGQNRRKSRDGMDMALCVLNKKTKELHFAGAYNPLWLVRNNELTLYKGDRMPVGSHVKEKPSFKSTRLQCQKGDRLYMFSDGYVDQFHAQQDVKFNAARFRKLVINSQSLSLEKQRGLLKQNFLSWKGQAVQQDDVLVLGVEI